MASKRRGHTGCPVGEDHAGAKLTEAKVRELRRLVHERGICCVCAGKLIAPDVVYSVVWDAVNYKTWKHVH